MIRVSEGKKYRFIGIGFVERNDAFNFKYELQHFSQQVANMKKRSAKGGIEDPDSEAHLEGLKMDLTHLKLENMKPMKIGVKFKAKEVEIAPCTTPNLSCA